MQHNVAATLQCMPLDVPPNVDIVSIFAHIQSQPWSILLDSSDSQHANAQFHIMVGQPLAHMSGSAESLNICYQDGTTETKHQIQPFREARALLDHYPLSYQQPVAVRSPFHCGLMGLFGYDLGKDIEHIVCTNPSEYDAPDIALGLYTWAICQHRQSGELFFCYHPDYPHPSAETLTKWINTEVNENTFSLTSDWQSNMTSPEYFDKIERIHHYLNAGDCYQVNLAQRFSAQYQGCEWTAYQRLRAENNAPFSAFIRLDNHCILSISPERFLSVNNGQVQTKPIKGTLPRGKSAQDDERLKNQLQFSSKDRAENLMIVDLLRNDLSRSCQPGSVQVPELFTIESFPAVHHLVSTVEGKIKPEYDCLYLLEQAFPGGSITGAPKIRAMEVIDELEPNRRNIYCGSIGYLDVNGRMDTSITIRTLLCERQTIYCWAGGGIVLDSVAELEYQESLDKVSKILPTLKASNAAT